MSKVSYLPKTNAYINWVFETIGKDRGGHHNYVAEQAVSNLTTAFDNQTLSQKESTDLEIFKHLHALDNNPDCLLIVNSEVFDDLAEVVEIFGQGCNYPTGKGVNGFQVDFEVIAVKDEAVKAFYVVFQSDDRTDNIKAYSGIEMSTHSSCDADESDELIEFMDYDYSATDEMQEIAKKHCLEWFESNK